MFSFEEFLLGESPRNRYGHVAIGEAELKNTLEKSGVSIQSFKVMKCIPRCLVRALKGNYSSDGRQVSG